MKYFARTHPTHGHGIFGGFGGWVPGLVINRGNPMSAFSVCRFVVVYLKYGLLNKTAKKDPTRGGGGGAAIPKCHC